MKRSSEPDDRAVEHHGHLARVVGSHVFGAQPPGHLEVDLHRAALPRTADRVLQVIFDLGTVKRALAGKLRPFRAAFSQRIAQRILGAIPRGVVTQPLLGSQGDLDLDVVESEIAVDGHRQLVEVHHLGLDLVLAAEDVAVILRERAHAHDSVQRAGRLVAMHMRRIPHSAVASHGSCACPN